MKVQLKIGDHEILYAIADQLKRKHCKTPLAGRVKSAILRQLSNPGTSWAGSAAIRELHYSLLDHKRIEQLCADATQPNPLFRYGVEE